jgi:hypothetical protein
MKTKIYISGSISGDPDYRRKFSCAEERLFDAGYCPVNPAKMNVPIEAWERAMRNAVIIMLGSDGVALLPDWKQSKGAKIEVRLARDLGIPVRPLEKWLEEDGKCLDRRRAICMNL